MKSRIFENTLALLAAVIILVAVGNAANTALSGDMGTLEIAYATQK